MNFGKLFVSGVSVESGYIMEDIVGWLVKGCLVQLLWFLILLPIALVIATPIILVAAVFGKDSYGENLKRYYRQVFNMIGESEVS